MRKKAKLPVVVLLVLVFPVFLLIAAVAIYKAKRLQPPDAVSYSQERPLGTPAKMPESYNNLLYVSGTLRRNDEVTVDDLTAIYTKTRGYNLYPSGNQYSIQELDEKHNVLFASYFDAGFLLCAGGSNYCEEIEEFPLELVIPYPEEARHLEIRNGEKVLYHKNMISYLPSIKLIFPSSGFTVEGVVTIRWEGDDRDGQNLLYSVEVLDILRNRWLLLSSQLVNEYAVWTTTDLPNGNYKLKLTATDGENEAFITSDVLEIKN